MDLVKQEEADSETILSLRGVGAICADCRGFSHEE
jgi:hypothetical protein